MNAPPDAQRVARRWIAKADEDLAAAERLLAIDDSLASVVCFHSQQAVEKLLEARYPIGEEPLTGEEARSAVDVATRLRAFVLRAVAPGSPSG
jgi:hypothetical protein